MALSPGTILGSYQIDAPLGAGGMGEVYKATDTRLDRTVAIKVLPEHVASDPDLKQRFEREARTVAALNHPHICTLHDIGSQDGIDFLVMEYLDGQTLAERLEKGALPLDQALQIAIDIADALDKAHRQGIVHRDLKPGNIMLTKAGAKLLDFGLAKLKPLAGLDRDGALAATQTASFTTAGAILGTPQYMAPEQAQGREADERTDIFTLGVVLYEMVTGDKAFDGANQASLIAAILEREPPPMRSLQPRSPRALDPLVNACLAKDPDDRWRSVGDVGRQVQTIAADLQSHAEDVAAAAGAPERRPRLVPLGIGVLVGSLLAGLIAWSLAPRPGGQPIVARLSVVPTGATVLRGATLQPDLAISADGTHILYRASQAGTAEGQLYVRALDQLEWVPVRGTVGVGSFCFSPDGEWVVFATEGQGHHVQKVALAGGVPETLARLSSFVQGAAWDWDDRIVLGQQSAGLVSAPVGGGALEQLTIPDGEPGETSHRWPALIGESEALLFAIDRGDISNSELAVLDLETREVSRLGLAGTAPQYVATGHLVYVSESGSLHGVAFDVDRLAVVGTPVMLADGITVKRTGAANMAIADSGSLVYSTVPDRSAVTTSLVWVDRSGVESPVLDGVRIRGRRPRLSPDEGRIAVWNDGNIDLWDLDRGARSTWAEAGGDLVPTWTPDGERIAFASDRAGSWNLYSRRAAPGSSADLLLETPELLIPGSWSPDGRVLAYYRVDPQTQRDLWVLPVGGSPTQFLSTEHNERNPRISPDGRWVAYMSDSSGTDQIYVQPFPDGGPVTLVSAGPGTEVVWSRDGRELFYRDGQRMMAVPVTPAPEFAAGRPVLLFDAPYPLDSLNLGLPNYDVSLDGQRFLMGVDDDERAASSHITIVTNWFEELKARVPTGQ